MRFLRNNRKQLNTFVFNEEDFSVLNYEQLLKVNGAGGSSGGGSSSGPSGGSSSSSGTDSRGYPSSTAGYNSGSSAGSLENQGYPSSTEGYNTGGNPTSSAQAALKGAQTNAMENPQYQQGSKGPSNYEGATSETTWCNQATYDVTGKTSPGLANAMHNGDPDNTNANAAANNLAAAANNPNSSIKEVSAEQAQNLANLGYTVAGAWENPSGASGHIATVAGGYNYNSESGPMMANVGTSYLTGIYTAKESYGQSKVNNGEVHYYYDSNQNIYN